MNTDKAVSENAYWNPNVILPYNVKADEINHAIADVYSLLHTINCSLLAATQDPLEKIVLGNTFSGMLSEFVVKSIAKHSAALLRNDRVGGHPDLLPKGHYPDTSVLRGETGIEVKTSRQSGGWQGHNPESCWIMIFRYELGTENEKGLWTPTRFVEVLCAELTLEDWALAERKSTSRRTRTVSINSKGLEKLRKNYIYRDPAYTVRPK